MKLIDGYVVCGNEARAQRANQNLDLFGCYGTSVCGGALREAMDEGDGALILARMAGDAIIAKYPSNSRRALVLATNFGAAGTMSWCWQEKKDTGEISQETYEPAQDYVRKLAAELGCNAGVAQISMSCASGLAALQTAQDMLDADKADSVLVIAYDEFAGCAATGLKILRTISPEGKVRPFDARRHGTVFGDGAAAALFVKDDAPDVGMGYVCGTATNNNAFHVTAPRQEGEGSRLVMASACQAAGVSPAQIRHVTAHATGTVANDSTESAALRNLLGDNADKVSLAAYKRVIGHKLGAAGLMELLLTADAINQGSCISPYGVDFEGDEKCTPFERVPARKVEGPAIVDAAGIGGNNAAVVYSKDKVGERKTACGTAPVYIRSMGWVLPDNVGCGTELFSHPEWLKATSCDGLADFSAKPYLSSVRGYMDAASAYLLSACKLALGEDAGSEINPRLGMAAFTQYGCPISAYKFFEQVAEKGEHASPLLFPHTYANTPTCLAAMEFGLGGPHTIFYGEQDISNAVDFACMRLYDGTADEMLLAFFEAFNKDAYPAGVYVPSGAVVMRLSLSAQGSIGTLKRGILKDICDLL